LKNGHQVNRYFSTSNPRRFNVDIYLAIGQVDFLRQIDVDSTSKSICADIVYFSTSNQRLNFLINEACRFINVEYRSIPRRGFPTVQDDFSTLIARRFDAEISQSITTVDSSTSNIRPFQVEVSQRCKRDIIGDREVPDDVPFAFLSALNQWCKLKSKVFLDFLNNPY